MDEDTAQAAWDQEEQLIQQWIEAGCPPPSKEIREAVKAREDYLKGVWRGN